MGLKKTAAERARQKEQGKKNREAVGKWWDRKKPKQSEQGKKNTQAVGNFLKSAWKRAQEKAAKKRESGSSWKERRANRKGGKNKEKLKTTKKMGSIERENRQRFGDKTVDRLKSKNTDFQSYKKGKMTKAQFIKKYPNSNLAKGR